MVKKLHINENNKRCFTKEARTSNPKFISVYVSQEFVPGYGWEDITVYDDTSDASLRDAKQDVKDYRDNGYNAKVITRKINNPNYTEPDSTITFDDAVEWVETCPYNVKENYAQYPNKNYTLESDDSWNTVQIFIYDDNIVKVRNCEANRTRQVYSIAELEKEVSRIFKILLANDVAIPIYM